MPSIFSKVRVFASDLPIRRKSVLVLSIPVIVLVLSTALFSYAQWKADVAERWVKHTLEVETGAYQIYLNVLAAQGVAREYATNDFRDAAPYLRAKTKLPELLSRVEKLTGDSLPQTERVRTLGVLIHEMTTRLDAVLAKPPEVRSRPMNYQQWQKQHGLRMGEITQALVAMLVEEERLLAIRTAERERARKVFNVTIGLSLFFGIIGTFAAAGLFASGVTRRLQLLHANANLLEQGLPMLPLPSGSDEIGRLGAAMESASALLAERSVRLKLALKTARVALWEIDSASGQIRYEGREEFLDSVGYPAHFLPSTLDAFFGLIEEDARAATEREFASALANDVEFRGECQLAGAGYSTRSVAVTARQYFRGQKSPALLGAIIDVTERKRSEQLALQQTRELTKSEQHLREQTRILQCVLNSMGDGVAVADGNGSLLLMNPAAGRILGTGAPGDNFAARTEQYGILSADQVTPYPVSELPLARALRGFNVDAENLFVRNANVPQGAWISCTARPLKDEYDVIWGAVVVFGDVTARKQADEALRAAKDEAEHANRAKSEFLSRMSHELRTPLNSILGFSQILKMHDLSERSRECVEHVLKGGTHLLGLIDEVLDIARIEAGKLSLSREPVAVTDSVNQVLDLMHPIADARGILLGFECSEDCRQHVFADRQRLHQVLLNLLSNAVKYNRDRGKVEVFCTASEPGRMRINVKDTGVGMRQADQKRLFTPFERLGADLSEIQGSGLGLAVSKRLMEAMGGMIGFTSQPGAGSTFWIDLPLADAPEEVVRRNEHLNGTQTKNTPGMRTVLYIEDNLSNMRLMNHIMSYRPQIRLIPAMKGRLGLELAFEYQPDLILLDLHLPDLGGEEVLTRLQADPRTCRIPVVMISADATPGQVNRLLKAGVSAYLTKPLNVEKLLSVLDDCRAEPGLANPFCEIEEPVGII